MKINKYFDIHFERADDATISKRLIGGAKIKRTCVGYPDSLHIYRLYWVEYE